LILTPHMCNIRTNYEGISMTIKLIKTDNRLKIEVNGINAHDWIEFSYAESGLSIASSKSEQVVNFDNSTMVMVMPEPTKQSAHFSNSTKVMVIAEHIKKILAEITSRGKLEWKDQYCLKMICFYCLRSPSPSPDEIRWLLDGPGNNIVWPCLELNEWMLTDKMALLFVNIAKTKDQNLATRFSDALQKTITLGHPRYFHPRALIDEAIQREFKQQPVPLTLLAAKAYLEGLDIKSPPSETIISTYVDTMVNYYFNKSGAWHHSQLATNLANIWVPPVDTSEAQQDDGLGQGKAIAAK
jgi:hypothetical protein